MSTQTRYVYPKCQN